jgi:signal transduction histidine kinase
MDDTPHSDVLGSYGRRDLRPDRHRGLRRPGVPAAAPQLLAKMSDELHTSLTSILVYARLLADNPHKRLSDEEVGFATGIHQAGSTLLQRIDDILDLPEAPHDL